MTIAHSTLPAESCNPRAVPAPHFPPLLSFEGLRPRDFQVAAALEAYAQSDPGCWPAVASLAKRVAACRRTIQYSLGRLVRSGALAIGPAANPTGRVLLLRWRRGGVQPAAPPPNLVAPPPPPPPPSRQAVAPDPADPGGVQAVAPDLSLQRTQRNVVAPVSGTLPLKAALEGLGPGSDVRGLAHRIATRFGDVHSLGFYIGKLREAAHDPAAQRRLLAAFGAAEGALTRGTTTTPGRLFVATWKGYVPPTPPSAINRPSYHRADRPSDPPPAASAPSTPPTASDFEPWLARPIRDPIRRLAAALARSSAVPTGP